MNLITLLHNLGLSLNEAKIYLATLEIGPASAQRIAKKAGLMRTTTYSVLENLAVKGFIFKTKEKDKNRYFADSPKNLFRRFSRYYEQFEKGLPQLEAIHNQMPIKPKIVFYEGKDGIKEIYEDTIKERPKEILEYNTSNIAKTFPDFPKEYVNSRRKAMIRAKRIAPNDKFWVERARRDNYEMSETRLLSPEKFTIPVEINIYNNKVAFMSYPDEMGIIIESKGVAEAMKKIYELAWAEAKRLNGKI